MKMDRTSPETLGGLEEGLSALGDPAGATKAREMKEIAEKIRERVLRSRRDKCAFEQKGEAFLEAARLYLQLGSLGDAVRYFRLARAASPDTIDPYRALAEIATAPGECFFRANSLGNILRLNPRDESAAGALAALYSQLGVRLKKGVELARLSLREGSSPEGSCVLAELLFQLGDLEAASREVETALADSPNDKRLKDLAARVAVAIPEQVESVRH
jgi:tetratricopeptide (TPR) repeat protein